jgi:DNA-binding CsgD family transcriptional regulator
MPSIDEIARRRSLPGILIFDQNQAPVYLSTECHELLREISYSKDTPETTQPIPAEIYRLLRAADFDNSPESSKPCYAVGIFRGDKQYLVRATPLFKAEQKKDKGTPHIMIFIERFSLGRRLDIVRLRRRFDFTDREAQVVGEIVKGLTNSEIAESLFISEHTVKDHIKNIMHKLGVHNRTSIFCRVFE